jgi:nickel transport protein
MRLNAIFRRILPRAAVLLLFFPAAARGHKVYVFAYKSGGDVVAETYFAGGGPCREAAVRVFEPGGKLLLSGTTDEKGIFSFPRPAAGDLRIVVFAGPGHRGEYLLPSEDRAPPRSGSRDAASGREETAPRADDLLARLKALDARLDRMGRDLAMLRGEREGVTWEKVLAGLGYILGITGLAVLLRRRVPRGAKPPEEAAPRRD